MPMPVARLKNLAAALGTGLFTEWLVFLGLVSLISLFYLWPYVPTPAHRREKDARLVSAIEGLRRGGHAAEAQAAADQFLRFRPQSAEVGRAYYVGGLAALDQARRRPDESAPTMRALDFFRGARARGFDPALVAEGFRSVSAFHERQRRYEAADVALAMLGDPADDLRRAWVIARAARLPSPSPAFTMEAALARVTAFEASADPARRARAAVARARILALNGRLQNALDVLDDAFIAWPVGESLAPYYMERGRLHRRLGDLTDEPEVHFLQAASDFEEAARRSTSPADVDAAMIFTGDMDRRLKFRKAEDRLRPLFDSPLRDIQAVAHLTMGRYRQDLGRGDPLPHFEAGLARIDGPGVLDEFEIDVEALFDGALLPLAEKESDPARLMAVADLIGHLKRLYPAEVRYREARERLVVRAARAWRDKSDEAREGGDVQRAAELARRSADLFRVASSEWLELADLRGTDAAVRAERTWRAAHRLAEGRWFLEAASLYGTYFDMNPAKNGAGLYLKAVCLHRAGILENPEGARSVLEQFRRQFPASDPLATNVTIELARVMGRLGQPAEALAILRPLTGYGAPDSPVAVDAYIQSLSLNPAENFDVRPLGFQPEARRTLWGTALLETGRAALDYSRRVEGDRRESARRDAEAALETFRRRYLTEFEAGRAAPAADALDVYYTLGQLYVEWSRPRDAKAALDFAAAIGERDDYPMSPPEAIHWRTAHYLLGDLALAAGDFSNARAIYLRAYRRFDAHADSIWAIAGLVEVCRRLGLDPEAKDHLEAARRHLEEHVHGDDPDLGPSEIAYWRKKLE